MSPVVTPYRFTDRPREVIDFLELLGLRTLLRQDDFAILAGRSGRVAVHPRATQNRPHEHPSTLVLGVPDVPAAAEELSAAGLDATWWDEAFGRQASVAGPAGLVTLDEEVEDTYGYDVVAEPAVSAVDVVATLFPADLQETEAFFRRLGFAPGPDASPDWRSLRAGERSGALGLMAPTSDAPAPSPGREAYAEIGVETAEALGQLADRLRGAGHAVAVVDDSGPTHLVVRDPDGIELEVYRVRELADRAEERHE